MELETAPNISNFIVSLRDIGYSLDTAIADIIDNSITAGAKNVKIYASSDDKKIAIFDDGSGMNYADLIEAMRLGSRSPKMERANNDLGRFGLGLKTASFSQCTQLSVFSKTIDSCVGFCWDLNYISKQNKWLLKQVDINCYQDAEWYNDFFHTQTGTIVIWENIDRFTDDEFNLALDGLCEHLSLVFHRFLDGEFINRRLSIYINNRKINPFNPFNTKHPCTQEKTTEKQIINGETVSITPYILPHYSKVSVNEYNHYATRDGYQKSQGFYLYREGRLLIHGTWFRLHTQCEAHKLVRIKIDINNKLDHLWKIDVKKSTASPAPQIRDELKRIIRQITEQGFKVYKQRGSFEKNADITTYWSIRHKDGKIKYIINKEHPGYNLLKNTLDENQFKLVDNYLALIEECLPLEAIMAKMMENPKIVCQTDVTNNEEIIRHTISSFFNVGLSNEAIINLIKNDEVYKKHLLFIEKLLKELR